jgi:hypothetical protein
MHRRGLIQVGLGALAAGALAVSGLGGVLHAGERASAQSGGSRQSLIVVGDMVRSGESVTPEEAPFLACTEQNRYPQGTQVVFRMKVIDPATQQPMDPSQVQSVTLQLPDGSSPEFVYHPLNRGMSPDKAWIAVWSIPDDYPTGAVDLQLTATDNQGRTGAWTQFNEPDSALQVVPMGSR